MAHRIRRVVVLGAGTMGAAIAAHCANAGLEVDLLDIAPDEPDAGKNDIVEAGFKEMKNTRPAALMSAAVAERISLGNFDDDYDRVTGVDWILEAIVEELEPKRELVQRVDGIANEDAIIFCAGPRSWEQ
jgi:3-hydroxyacyl-CoA dehydrogenase